MKINSLTKDEVFRSLVTSANGLTEEEAEKRLQESGFNEIKETRKTPLFLKFLGQFTHLLAILLWVGAILSFVSEYIHPGEGMLNLGIAVVGVIFINAVFTFFQEYRAEKALEALKKMLPFNVKVIRNSRELEVPSRDVVHGDILFLTEGDKVSADARIIEDTMLKVNNAPLTGESEPLLRSQEPFKGELLISPNIIFAGTTVTSGSGKAVVFATGMRTEFGRIAHLTSAVEAGLSPLQKEIIRATRLIAVIAAAVGIFFFTLGFLIGRSFWENFIFAIGITVALIPEGLLPTVTLALAMGSQRMAKRKALIKKLTSVETLGSVSVICTDKTGTITQNKMEVKNIWTSDNQKTTQNYLMLTAFLCNNARFIDQEYKGDPTETALLKYAREAVGSVTAERISEIPFDSDRKRMTTLYRIEQQSNRTVEQQNINCCSTALLGYCTNFVSFTKGALESVLPLCSHVLINGEKTAVDETTKETIRNANHTLMDKGLRVLAFAYKELRAESLELRTENSELEKDMVFLGLIGLEDPPRPEVPEAIKKCNAAGIKVIMITGDSSRTAVAIAREIGLVNGDPVLIEGPEFIKMSDVELREKLSMKEIIFSRMTPKHKMRVVSLLKEQGERVAVTGDGVNDAPALRKADIGISMGLSGTDVAKEASDMILLDDNFATIVNAVEEGRTVYENIKKFITYIFSSNIPEAVPYLAYILLNIPLPLTIMQILAVDLGTDMLPALALGAEKPTSAVMTQPPRKPNERLLNFQLMARAYLFLGPIEAAACMFGFFFVLYSGGWHWGEVLTVNNRLYMQATTACLTAIILTQIGNVFACRTHKESVFRAGIFGNRLMLWAILSEILLSIFIIYHPWGNRIFSTAPVGLSVWLVLIPFMLLVFFAEEFRKMFLRRV
ncbi:MAG: ATPase [Nitrospirae bacterium GWC2_42_7]|nr:MAG: ATPase [Nitrospirae bacterium GWC2_42_7]